MGLMWFIVGLLTGLSVFCFVELKRRFNIDWKAWAGLIVGVLMILFCIAWTVASVFEGEPRAASLGLMMFGGTGVIVLVLTRRLLVQKAGKRSN